MDWIQGTQDRDREKAMAMAMFPRMPANVFELFLFPLIDEYGWPFSSIDAHLQGTRWEFAFQQVPLRYIAECCWTLMTFRPSEKLLFEGSRNDMEYVWKNYLGILPKMVNYDYERCRASTHYHLLELGSKKRFASPVVLLQR